ncbi:hypothetical protein RhiirC2_804406 [Rhizophagus irregularis]|uniref:Uncharacterized protein n=1 Tax=Rhizophagus irregularis TaxID=588596 RepID=A0A2N1L0B7_9GLOM|nr:hypothetical protein RhiirC2_804406 [Rhizophagus irregularis]
MQTKRQRKYQTVCLSIELNTFHLAQFEVNENPVWTTDLGDTSKGNRKFIGYFKKWIDMQTALDNQYTWKQVNLSWN